MMSIWHLLLVLIILLLFMGPGRIEKLGPSLGKALRGFKKGLSGDDEDSEDSDTKTVNEQTKKLEARLENMTSNTKTKKKKADYVPEDEE